MDWNAICVDDGSTDATWSLLGSQGAMAPRWQSLSQARNFGHHTAISAGLHHARGDVVVVMAADLQDPPEELGRFLDQWREGYEVVFAIRRRQKEGMIRRTCYLVFYRRMVRLVSIDIPLDSGDSA